MGFMMIYKIYEKHLTPGRYPVPKICQSKKTASNFLRFFHLEEQFREWELKLKIELNRKNHLTSREPRLKIQEFFQFQILTKNNILTKLSYDI